MKPIDTNGVSTAARPAAEPSAPATLPITGGRGNSPAANGAPQAPAAAAGAERPAGNLTIRDLARTLSKTEPHPGADEPANGTVNEAAASGREEETETEGALPEGEGAAGEGEGEQEQEQEQGQEQEPEAQAKPGLPEELVDAMAIAKGDKKEGVAKLLKRVHTLADQRDTERNGRLAVADENKALRAELQQLRQGGEKNGQRNGNSPNGWTHPEVARAGQELANVDHWLTWCEENAGGGEVPDGKGGNLELTTAQVRAVERDLQRQRQELVARKVGLEGEVRRRYETQFGESHALAVKEYPWLAKADAPERAQFEQILEYFPAFKQSPDYELSVGDYLAGKALREARAKARVNGTRKATPARVPTNVPTNAPAQSARRTNTEEEDVKTTEEAFSKSGSVRDLAKSFAAKRRVAAVR